MCRGSQKRISEGSVLLEVVLALVIFVAAATIITSGMNASVQAVQKLRLNTHAMNLAISVMSELQMRARPMASAGPEPFEPPFEKWSWKIDVTDLESGPLETDAMKRVEVIVRNNEERIVQRLSQLFRAADVAEQSQQPQVAPKPAASKPLTFP
jgi:type II secretion system protein I